MADFFFGSPFRRLFHARPFTAFEWSSGAAAMDWVETPASHVLRINVPGLGKDDVKVQVEEGNVLTIRGAPPAAKEKDKGKGKGKEDDDEEGTVWHVAERGKPEFARAVALPENVRVDGIRAGVENGVLTVVVPKEAAPSRPKPRPIAVSSKL